MSRSDSLLSQPLTVAQHTPNQAAMEHKNIFIIGAQCTGKTTIVNALKDHYTRNTDKDVPEPTIITEVARTVLKDLEIDRHDIANSPGKSLQLQSAILKAQYQVETKAKESGSWYVSDRSGIDPIVYARLFVGEAAAQDLLTSPEWLTLEQNLKSGHVFLCEAGCTWLIDDGTRLMPKDAEQWEQFDQAFRKLLAQREVDYRVIPRDVRPIDERVAIVTKEHEASVTFAPRESA